MKNYQDFISSFSFDKRLAKYDIIGSIAHTKMLVKSKIISDKDGKRIIAGLQSILDELNNNKKIIPSEDIHYAIEKELISRIGPAGGKMHTARSRNDQVSLDIRLYIKDEIKTLQKLIGDLQKAVITKSKENIGLVMPGYTHLQPAQPVLFSHYILAYAWMFQRDKQRLLDCLKRVNVMPLGSAALAGTSFNIDRNYVAKLLGFEDVTDNSIDTVSDRDFVVELLSDISIIGLHLSRLCEDFVIWSSIEFNFIRIDDKFTSGSSIMPQKQNPDVAEIVRGKTGRIYGNLMSMLTIMKGLPLTYNRDMQEDKPPLFDSIDTIKACIEVMTALIDTIEVNSQNLNDAVNRGFLCATELADYLVKKGLPFRMAHAKVKEIVEYCINNNKTITDLRLDEIKSYSNLFDNDFRDVIDSKKIIADKKSEGGTSLQSVKKQIKKLERLCN